MCKHAVTCSLALLAALAAAQPSRPWEECFKQAGSEVVVQAFRFSDGRSYAYRVTNNGTKPLSFFAIGRGSYIKGYQNTDPVSIGSPGGWTGMEMGYPDPRLPESHSPILTLYKWYAEDGTAVIQPGRSLSGFSVQLPTPREAELAYLQVLESAGVPAELPKDPPMAERMPPQPNLADIDFEVTSREERCTVVGTVELDRGWSASDTPGS